MRRIAALLALTVGASLLAGCVYDPYTGTWRAVLQLLRLSRIIGIRRRTIRTAIRPGLIWRRKVSPHRKVSRVHIRASRRQPPPGPGASE